ncbi:hypothetical protein [Magnetospira sp. QH-2]|uniref:hypothetical protein n=1 Tax=Magnetospira sp. (strain QH-2) TaxID=1288970 RepID=UPI0003E80E71|nr:hypothetical protein [Magnetospira sp. QH-2]CCQ73432.1 Exported protein of unknown function [Magnetospira sp. QH-2]
MRVLKPFLAVALLQAGGCASIVSDNDSTTYIRSKPAQAACDLSGHNFQRSIVTPSSVTMPANAAPVTIACQADGYQMTTAQLDTSMDGWIFGNLIFGGIIGAAIDLGRGAGQIYPTEFDVALHEVPGPGETWHSPDQAPTTTPKDAGTPLAETSATAPLSSTTGISPMTTPKGHFASLEARDTFFDKKRFEVAWRWEQAFRDLNRNCQEKRFSQKACMADLRIAEARRDREMQDVEMDRLRAGVNGLFADLPPSKSARQQGVY